MAAAVKAYIYSEDGSLLGYLACVNRPPEVLELNGRFFKHAGVAVEVIDDDEIDSLDYWEIDPIEEYEIIEICVSCGRNSSMAWWKCCPKHVELDSPSVFCQSCVEKLHPGDPEFERD